MLSTHSQKVQERLRKMQDVWLSNKVDEIQGYADRHNLKNFYDALKEVYGWIPSGPSPLLSAEGSTLITDKVKILHRWGEHFDSVLNRPSSISDETINSLPQVPTNGELDDLLNFFETQKAIRLLSHSKTPGSDSIPEEVYKEGSTVLVEKFHHLFCLMWQQEKIPQEFRCINHSSLQKKGNP